MMNETIIQANKISLRFPILGTNAKSLRKSLINVATGGKLDTHDKSVSITALDNVSFNFFRGDIVGITGHNGAGKSTLLRVLAGIHEVSSGHISINGSVLPLLNINVGMDQDASGLDNIFIKGWLLGFKTNEIKSKIDDIINFSELGEYINLPVRTYSTGMVMRLFFATITAFERDILLMDEWLSVGDERFSEKANLRLNNLMNSAKLIVITSHNQDLINKLCNRIFNMNHGRLSVVK
jgi:lipopolysaccharide transport system ATP-binding protein